MTSLACVTLEVTDTSAADRFYADAFGLGKELRLRASDAPTSGFRGFTLSLTVARPSTVDSLHATALAAGAKELKPLAKSLWGYGSCVQALDGTIWTLATSAKKDPGGPVSREIERFVLLLGVTDMVASKEFYVGHGLTVGKSFGRKYTEFETSSGAVQLALYSRKGLAKQAGVAMEGSGSHRIVIGGDAGTLTDPDGFAWEPAGQ